MPARIAGRVQSKCIKKLKVVGETGFEPATLCSQNRCATRLRHSPTLFELKILQNWHPVGPEGFEPPT